MVDFCEVTVLKRRNALKKEKKSAKKAADKPHSNSVRTVGGGLPVVEGR